MRTGDPIGDGLRALCAYDSLFERVQRLSAANAQLRNALHELLDLDARRPADSTWWRKWWDEARARAELLLEVKP